MLVEHAQTLDDSSYECHRHGEHKWPHAWICYLEVFWFPSKLCRHHTKGGGSDKNCVLTLFNWRWARLPKEKKNQTCKAICHSITWMHLFKDLIAATMFLHQRISFSSLCLPNVNDTSCSRPGIISGSNNCWMDLLGYRELLHCVNLWHRTFIFCISSVFPCCIAHLPNCDHKN